jgi:hypothetical protein
MIILIRRWGLLLALLGLGWLSEATGVVVASPPSATAPPWVTVYLTQQRVCQRCWLWVDEPNERVWLQNQQGVGAYYPRHEVLRVDGQPAWQHQLLNHWATHLHPVVVQTLLTPNQPQRLPYALWPSPTQAPMPPQVVVP